MLNDVHNTWHSRLKITWKVKYFAYCVTQSIKNEVVLHNGAKKLDKAEKSCDQITLKSGEPLLFYHPKPLKLMEIFKVVLSNDKWEKTRLC